MIRSLLSLIVLLFGASAFAQTPTGGTSTVPQNPTEEEKFTFGVAISFSPIQIAGDDQTRFNTIGMTDLAFPIQLGPYIRIEPALGLYFQSAPSFALFGPGTEL